MKTKQVYFFGGGKAEADISVKELLGGKGAALADMTTGPFLREFEEKRPRLGRPEAGRDRCGFWVR